MNEQFKYDVFLSHSSKDKPAVRELAERLRRDGLRVWFVEWEIRPGDLVPLKIEDALEQSRTLVLTMSANATPSEWVTFERHAVMFRDLANQERRFIPLRLDDAEIKDVLKQFAYVDWRQRGNEEYARLLMACRPSIDKADLPSTSKLKNRLWRRVIGEHDNQVSGVALTSDGRLALSASNDGTVRIWDVFSGKFLQELLGHSSRVSSVAVTQSGSLLAVSGSLDGFIRVWELASGKCLVTLRGHISSVLSLAVSNDGQRVVSASKSVF